MATVFLNNRFLPEDEASISPLDRGFLFADGVYEVIPSIDGMPFGLEPHLQRLQRSLDGLRITNPYPMERWRTICRELLAQNGGGDAAIYLQVTRGAPTRRDHAFPPADVPPTVFMTVSPLVRPMIYDAPNAQGGSAITAPDNRWGRCDIKSIALLPNVLYRQQAVEAGVTEVIMIKNGWLTEGSSTNVFVVHGGVVATPPLSTRILGGVTRNMVVDLCVRFGLRIEEREVSRSELVNADEVWLTSSSKDVLPIVKLDGRPIGAGKPGATWLEFAPQYLAYKQRACLDA